MNNEVSAAEIHRREARNERIPPSPRSRWRIIAVMAAVVIGCGVAGLVVCLGPSVENPSVENNARQIEQTGTIGMPRRTAGVAGLDATLDQIPTRGPDGAGHGAEPPATGETTSADRSAEVPPTSSPATVPDTATPRSDPPSRTPSTRYSAKSLTPSPPRTATGAPKPCLLLVFC